jgi:dinuclear metal center YbgI/SA1388 family protein
MAKTERKSLERGISLATIRQLIELLDQIAPSYLALADDNVGLQIGAKSKEVEAVLVALNVNEAVLREAMEVKAGLLVCHHPLFFKPIRELHLDSYTGRIVEQLLHSDIALFVMHTNFDRAEFSVSHALAEAIGLSNVEVLAKSRDLRFYKLAVYVPSEYTDRVLKAMASAGAGTIGRYTYCSFRTSGTGTFKPPLEAKPFAGEPGKLSQVEEVKLEVVVPPDRLEEVIKEAKRVHPYEEMAYDVYETVNIPINSGLGVIGKLRRPEKLGDLLEKWCNKYGWRPRVVGDLLKSIETVALCGGSGGSLIRDAVAAKADLLLTGDVKYHQALEAKYLGLAVVDIGHAESEEPGIDWLAAKLREMILSSNLKVRVFRSKKPEFLWLRK